MKNKLCFAAVLAVSVSFFALTNQINAEESTNFQLDENKAADFQLKETLAKEEISSPQTTDNAIEENKPQIIREEIEGGYIEKMLTPDGKVLAEKTIKNDVAVKKVLNYYTPNGQLQRRITIGNEQKGFFAEEYYPNGNIAAQATFINESNKIGEERKFDSNGILRQEIVWKLPLSDKSKPVEELRTIRHGDIITYYPNGAKAAIFSVGKAGNNIFYRPDGSIIKEIKDSEILTFARELTPLDCQEKAVQLSLEDLVELYEDEGDISYNKCGLPYREAFVYEVIDERGDTATKISYDETGQIRRITPYQNGQKEGILQKFDASGNVTAEIAYHNGVKDGEAIGYFPTRERAFYKTYQAGKVVDTLRCYFPTGEIAAEFHYENGKKNGTAVINSPVSQTLEFSDDQMLNKPETAPRVLNTRLSELEVLDERCLNVGEKTKEILSKLENNATLAESLYAPKLAQECQDITSYQIEENRYACYDAANRLRAEYPLNSETKGYITVKTYAADGTHQYDIPYLNNQRQGWAKQYDLTGNIIAEMYFNNNEPDESARSYHPNGTVKELISLADGAERKVITAYNTDGEMIFNLSYKDGKKSQAFITEPEKNKDIYIRFYDGALDNIRETNAGKPFNYIEYNLALGEYTVSREGELIKGGYLCQENKNSPISDDFTPIGEEDLKALDAAAEKAAADYKLKNALIPTAAEKQQAKLAAKNIGPVATPDIETLTDSVEKKSLRPNESTITSDGTTKTEKFNYPNGGIRKSIKTRNGRTEEIKEYSKSGLLLTDIMYNNDKMIIEKYFGSGSIRRKTEKSYNDNAIMAFISREDFYDNANPRYTITRQPDALLFNEKRYTPEGKLKQETEQKSPLSLLTNEYDKNKHLQKQTETLAANTVVKEYDADGKLTAFSLNGKDMPLDMAKQSDTILRDNTKIYNKGVLKAEVKADKRQNTLVEYHPGKIIKTEIIFYNNGEISVKGYANDGTLTKFAYLAPDGKLHLQKPEVRTIPNYRERWWVDYNNPNWVENQDKYSIKSISRLYLDTAAHILAELEWEVPEIMQRLYEVY
ncbi:MAG: hypothetical protein NC218_04600 [Acetobacter sp.]|nr:hypothetical protein [Acetobacter sp.]